MAGITSAEVSAQARVAAHMADVGVAVELETPEMTLNIGPQHPSTHGVFRLVARVEGEKIEDVEPVIGYMHRGYEKLCEVRTYPQITTLVNRIDWLSRKMATMRTSTCGWRSRRSRIGCLTSAPPA